MKASLSDFSGQIRKQFCIFTVAKFSLFHFVGKFMDRVTDALDEIKKKKHETSISALVQGSNKLV